MTDYQIFVGKEPGKGFGATSTTLANPTVDPGTTGLRYGQMAFHGIGLSSDDFVQNFDATLFQPQTEGVYEIRLFMGLPGPSTADTDPNGYYLVTLVQDDNRVQDMQQLNYAFVPDVGGVAVAAACCYCHPALESAVHVEVQRAVTDPTTADVRMSITDMFQLDIVKVS